MLKKKYKCKDVESHKVHGPSSVKRQPTYLTGEITKDHSGSHTLPLVFHLPAYDAYTGIYMEFLLQVDSYDVRVGEDLGGIILVKLQKKKFWVHDDWYCRYITVKTPAGDYVEFPCFRWLVDDTEVVLRDGRGGCPLPSCFFFFYLTPRTPHFGLSLCLL